VSRDGDPHRDLEGTLHEISNALTVLLGWVAEARSPGATEEELAHALKIVDQRARRARDLARRSIGAKTIPADIEADLGIVLADVVASLAIEAARVGARLVLEGPPEVSRIALGEDLSQIVTNLALNALAYAPRGSDVKVIATTTPTDVTIEVIDLGPGVPDSRRESVFEGDTQREGGAGVGLRHARAIARAAGGELGAVDPEGGQGGRFRLRWPRSDVRLKPTASRRPSSQQTPALSLADWKVLVVEDDADVTDLLEAGLGARGATVTTVRTETELHAAVANDPPDAVLLDLSPIKRDPTGAMAKLRSAAPNAAVVFVTGSGDAIPEGIEGAEFVRKPFELAEIVGALARARRG
jgi:CheY-like chemotaxis protein